MNCSVCGGPLLFSRVAFRCSCGAHVHAYCLDSHILVAHRPDFEEGRVDLNGDFHPMEEKVETPKLREEAEVQAEASESAGAEVTAEEENATGIEGEEEEESEEVVPEPAETGPGFVEVDSVPEEEKLESGDVSGDEEERSSEANE